MADDTAKNELSKKISDIGLDKNYYKVYPLLGKVLKLKPLELHIFSIIYSYNINGQEYAGSTAHLIKLLKASRMTIIKSLEHLEAKEYIQKTRGDFTTTNRYSVNIEKINEQIDLSKNDTSLKTILVQKLDNPSIKTRRGVVQKLDNPSLKTRHSITNNNTNNISKNNINAHSENEQLGTNQKTKNKPSNSKKEANTKLIELFNEFWTSYPRKQSKKKALEIWIKKIKPSDELFKVIMQSLEQWKKSEQWQKDGGKYIPYPTTWLNGERWNDEIKTTNQQKPPQDTQDTGEGKPQVKNSKEALIREYYENEGANKNGDTK